MTRHKHRSSPLRLRSIYIWHRYVGVAASFFIIVLSVTGIMLNHTEKLNSDSEYIESGLILDWYGIQVPNVDIAYYGCNEAISHIEDQLYFGKQRIEGVYQKLKGVISVKHFCVILTENKVLLVDDDGEKIDTLKLASDLNTESIKLGSNKALQVIISDEKKYFVIDNEWLAIQLFFDDITDIYWSKPMAITENLNFEVRMQYRSKILTKERLVLDIHSGRFIGSWGIFVMDLAAIFLLLLSASGVFLWWRQLTKRRK